MTSWVHILCFASTAKIKIWADHALVTSADKRVHSAAITFNVSMDLILLFGGDWNISMERNVERRSVWKVDFQGAEATPSTFLEHFLPFLF
jgi:hypothetical protein